MRLNKGAFAECNSISTIEGCENIENVGNGAFRGLEKINSINISKKVINIGDGAFYGCTELKKVIWNSEDCINAGISTAPIFGGCNKLETIVIGDNVKTIPSFAFYNCSGLVNVTIGTNIMVIEEWAFSGCNKLNNISFNGTIEQWNNIKKGKYYLYDVPASQIVCSDGNIEL